AIFVESASNTLNSSHLGFDYLLNHQSLEKFCLGLKELRVSCLFSKNLLERTFCSLIDLEVFGDKLQRLKRL
ncbi:unnamed protein product, partial [Brassica oleracea]